MRKVYSIQPFPNLFDNGKNVILSISSNLFIWHTVENTVLAEAYPRVPKQSVHKQSVYILWLQ